ncbi:hypothetical protein CDAR_315601 [Caerostris darwini]|uniref:Uncharacterized protein n=1 Tax=Caerostris darwini TaxID=1538125 RepID=A0AAV4TSR1_9ARAC|nr:hypothetical protein CDAR_315601 [Caerostris darwini]
MSYLVLYPCLRRKTLSPCYRFVPHQKFNSATLCNIRESTTVCPPRPDRPLSIHFLQRNLNGTGIGGARREGDPRKDTLVYSGTCAPFCRYRLISLYPLHIKPHTALGKGEMNS